MKPRKIIKAFASLKLAVVIVLALAGLSAWGTFVEAKYNDSAAAQRIVYHSPWMVGTMLMLAVSLTAVMIDRWPWQRKHLGFVMAHIGILILMAGAVVTHELGVDGSISFGIGESARMIAVGETDFTVYSSLDGERYAKIFDREVDFNRHAPKDGPLAVPLPEGEITVTDYYPYALRDDKIVAAASDSDEGAAVRFQLQNDRVNMTDWIQQQGKLRDAVKELGPARVVLTRSDVWPKTEGNAIVMRSTGDDGISYEIRSASGPSSVRRGVARAGDSIQTGWMGIVLRVLKVLPHARTDVTFKALAAASPMTSPAVKVRFQGKDHWFGLNAVLKLFTENAVYVVSYGNRRVDIGFDMRLEKFTVGRYQGTMRAASYESVVRAPEAGTVTISMNEPLKLNGFTFYQSSFTEDDRGNPVASILSVNRDPGRPFKYLGSLLIVCGAVYMFYFKRVTRKKAVASGDRQPVEGAA